MVMVFTYLYSCGRLSGLGPLQVGGARLFAARFRSPGAGAMRLCKICFGHYLAPLLGQIIY